MVARRHDDGSGLDLAGQLGRRRERPRAVLLRHRRRPVRVQVADSDELGARQIGVEPRVVLAQVPHAHHADTDLSHECPLARRFGRRAESTPRDSRRRLTPNSKLRTPNRISAPPRPRRPCPHRGAESRAPGRSSAPPRRPGTLRRTPRWPRSFPGRPPEDRNGRPAPASKP